MLFEWDESKNTDNIRKHGVDFNIAKQAFFEINRITTIDDDHTTEAETRYFCFGEVEGRVMTVRFTIRKGKIRIFGAGYWRKGKKFYEQKNAIQ